MYLFQCTKEKEFLLLNLNVKIAQKDYATTQIDKLFDQGISTQLSFSLFQL